MAKKEFVLKTSFGNQRTFNMGKIDVDKKIQKQRLSEYNNTYIYLF